MHQGVYGDNLTIPGFPNPKIEIVGNPAICDNFSHNLNEIRLNKADFNWPAVLMTHPTHTKRCRIVVKGNSL